MYNDQLIGKYGFQIAHSIIFQVKIKHVIEFDGR